MTTKELLVIAGVALFAISLWPVDAGCGAPHTVCATPPVEGVSSTRHVSEPAGIFFLESITGTDLSLEYSVKYD